MMERRGLRRAKEADPKSRVTMTSGSHFAVSERQLSILLLITDLSRITSGGERTRGSNTSDHLPTEIIPCDRLLTALDIQYLADVTHNSVKAPRGRARRIQLGLDCCKYDC